MCRNDESKIVEPMMAKASESRFLGRQWAALSALFGDAGDREGIGEAVYHLQLKEQGKLRRALCRKSDNWSHSLALSMQEPCALASTVPVTETGYPIFCPIAGCAMLSSPCTTKTCAFACTPTGQRRCVTVLRAERI
jgi:hypothetical protein